MTKQKCKHNVYIQNCDICNTNKEQQLTDEIEEELNILGDNLNNIDNKQLGDK